MRVRLTAALTVSVLLTAHASAQDGGVRDGGVAAALIDGAVEAPADDGGIGSAVEVPDAGPPEVDASAPSSDAGVLVPAPANGESDWLGVLRELIFERTEEAERAAQRADERLDRQESREARDEGAVAPVRGAPEAPRSVAEDVAIRVTGCEPGMLGFDLPERKISTSALLFLICFALLAIWLLDRARRPLPERGFVPRLLGLAHLAARAAAVIMVVMVATRLLPGWLRPALLFTIGGAALAIGAGAVWVVLPDVVGGLLLLTEGRLRPGLWVVGDGFRGTVERVGPRLTTLRTPDGARLMIPNRKLVRSSIYASDRRWHEVEVELTVPSGHDAPAVRRAVMDAVLCSPFVPLEPALEVTRDPKDPLRWKVKARVLDATYSDRFEGQLLERVEEGLDLL